MRSSSSPEQVLEEPPTSCDSSPDQQDGDTDTRRSQDDDRAADLLQFQQQEAEKIVHEQENAKNADEKDTSSSHDEDDDDEHDDDIVGPMRKTIAATVDGGPFSRIPRPHSTGGTSMIRPSLASAPMGSSTTRSSSVRLHSTGRIGSVRCLATGKEKIHAQRAVLRTESSVEATSKLSRQMHFFRKLFPGGPNEEESKQASEEEEDIEMQSKANTHQPPSYHGRLMVTTRHSPEDDPSSDKQFTLKAVKLNSKTKKFMQFIGATPSSNDEETGVSGSEVCSVGGVSPNLLVVRYLHWAFRSTFAAVFLSAACMFLGLTLMFALILWILGRDDPVCIGGVDFESDYFVDAFGLSWTTFSTVGYGLVYSGISADEANVRRCTWVTIVVSVEAFVGILFSSMCGAILFAKFSRAQSFAQVLFSDPMVIRYGTGLVDLASDDDDDEEEEDEAHKHGDEASSGRLVKESHLPCPYLEFRIANRLNSVKGGEIIDASLNIVASIDASQACSTLQVGQRRRGKKGKKKGPRKDNKVRRRKTESTETENLPKVTLEDLEAALEAAGENKNQEVEEDPTGRFVPKRIFSKLEVETPDHPFFKRMWTVRHKLDEFSPLLRSQARKMVQRNKGYWPQELNSAIGIRNAICFDQILVSMSGTSNADANSVYAQKAYTFQDVYIGYRFVNTLYRDESNDGALCVDTTLINDVMEQAGGGGEPFHEAVHEMNEFRNMMVL